MAQVSHLLQDELLPLLRHSLHPWADLPWSMRVLFRIWTGMRQTVSPLSSPRHVPGALTGQAFRVSQFHTHRHSLQSPQGRLLPLPQLCRTPFPHSADSHSRQSVPAPAHHGKHATAHCLYTRYSAAVASVVSFSVNVPSGRYFFRARSTPTFQVLMLSEVSCSWLTSLMTCVMGMR